jgi:sulfite exporter TauE/SafE
MSPSLLIGGLFAGFLHVLMGPDHLAAVAPSAALRGRDAWRSGLRWGLGHASGVICVGIALVLLRHSVDINKYAWLGERLVGVALVAIGLWGFRVLVKNRGVSLVHARHKHHNNAEQTALGVGILHGLAGGSHLFGVIPALALPSLGLSATWLLLFGIGTVVAMMTFTGILGWLVQGMAMRIDTVYRGALAGCSCVAIALGFWWMLVGGIG